MGLWLAFLLGSVLVLVWIEVSGEMAPFVGVTGTVMGAISPDVTT